jgi:hypothetical protein
MRVRWCAHLAVQPQVVGNFRDGQAIGTALTAATTIPFWAGVLLMGSGIPDHIRHVRLRGQVQ